MGSGDRSADDVDDDDRFSGMDDMFGADLEERKKKEKWRDKIRRVLSIPDMGDQPPNEADLEEGACTEEEIAEGTCGHGVNGKIGRKPAGPSLMDFFKDE